MTPDTPFATPNAPINPATNDLGTFGGSKSVAYGINASGQVVGGAQITGSPIVGGIYHAFQHGSEQSNQSGYR